MDDLEFRKRAYSDPFDQSADLLAATGSSPQRVQLIDQLKTLDKEIGLVLQGIPIPDMAGQLKSLAATALPNRAESAPDGGSKDNVIPLSKKRKPAAAKSSIWRNFTLAASLVVAVAVTLTLTPGPGPSAQDLEFHNSVVSHVYAEEPGYLEQQPDWQDVSQAVDSAGGRIIDENNIKELSVRFARLCSIDPKGRAAHLVFEGERGLVSVLLVKGGSVSTDFAIEDERFAGRILPLGDGNLAIVGEKGESLDRFQRLIIDNFEWEL